MGEEERWRERSGKEKERRRDMHLRESEQGGRSDGRQEGNGKGGWRREGGKE